MGTINRKNELGEPLDQAALLLEGSHAKQYERGTLPRSTLLFFGVGESATAICGTVLGFFLNDFLLNVAKLPAISSGIVLGGGRAWDAVTDPLCGFLTDRTRSRWGRRRPWLLFSAVPCGLAYVALWVSLPDTVSNAWKACYYFVAYCLLNTTFTAYSVPYTAIAPELANNHIDRSELVRYRMSFNVIATLISAILQSVTVDTVFKDDKEKGFLISAIVCAFFIIIPIWVTFIGVRERELSPEQIANAGPSIGFFEGLKLALRNRAYVFLTLLYLFSWLAVQFVQNNLRLYINEAVKMPSHFTYLLVVVLLSTFVFITVWSIRIVRHGKKKTFAQAMSIFFFVLVALTFIPAGEHDNPLGLTLMYMCALFAGAGVGAGFLIPWAMLPDVVDLDELQTGQRREGTFYSFFVFFQKMALGFALFLSQFALALGKYDTEAAIGKDGKEEEIVQPKSVGLVLRLLVGPISATFLLISFAFLKFYPITAESARKVADELDERKAKREAGLPEDTHLLMNPAEETFVEKSTHRAQ